jgi:hypothetical protein
LLMNFRMNSCHIQRFFPIFNPQKSNRLFIRFWSKSFHVFNLGFGFKRSMLIPICYNCFRYFCT